MKTIKDLSRAERPELDDLEVKTAREMLPHLFDELKKKSSHVVGIGVGARFQDGEIQKETCLHVLVTKKISERNLKESEILPGEFYGFKVDVLEVGEASFLGLTAKQRPLLAGYSCGGVYKNAHCMGTLGAFAKRDKSRFVLSNNHVLAANDQFPVDKTKVTQPAVQDGGTGDTIGELKQYVPLSKIEDNLVDAAIAEFNDEIEIADQSYSTTFVPQADIKLLDPVYKVGRTTERTEGQVVSLHVRVRVGERTFVDQVLVKIKAGVGDSGALGVRATDKHPMGLLFAGDISKDSIYFNPLETVLTLLNSNTLP